MPAPPQVEAPGFEVQDGFLALVELSPDAVFVIVDGYHAFANARGIALLGGRTIKDLRRQPAIEFMHPSCRTESRGRLRTMTDGDVLEYVEEKIVRLDGTVVDIEAAGTPIVVGERPAALVVVRDITARKRAEAELRAAELRFQAAFRHAPTGMAIVDAGGRVVEANAALAALLDMGVDELVGFECWQAIDELDHGAVRRALRTLAAGRASVASGEFRYRRPDRGTGWLLGSAAPLAGADAYVVHVLDVTAAKDAEDQLNYRATHDHLTGLPNRALMLERLAKLLCDQRPDPAPVAVLFIDLDGFKAINDAYGHAAGDELLCAVAERLRASVRPSDTVARLGGDEFVAVLAGAQAATHGRELAERIRASIRLPVALDAATVQVDASIGIAYGTCTSAEALLAEADAAMYQAKLRARGAPAPAGRD